MDAFSNIEEMRFAGRASGDIMAALFGVQCQMQPNGTPPNKKHKPMPQCALTVAQWALIDASLDGVLRSDIAAVVAVFHDEPGPRLAQMATGQYALVGSDLKKLETYALQIAWPARLHGFTRSAVAGPAVTVAHRTKYGRVIKPCD